MNSNLDTKQQNSADCNEDTNKIDQQKLNLEKSKIWLDFIKYLLVSGVIAFIGIMVNKSIKTRELNNCQFEMVGKFVNQALEENVGTRRRFAQYFSLLATDKEMKSGWENYFKIIDSEYKVRNDSIAYLVSLKKRTEDTLNIFSTNLSHFPQNKALQIKISQLENDLLIKNTSINNFRDSELTVKPCKLNISQSSCNSNIPDLIIHTPSGMKETAKKIANILGNFVTECKIQTVYGLNNLSNPPEINLVYFSETNSPTARNMRTVLNNSNIFKSVSISPNTQAQKPSAPFEIWFK